jgi:hypothetical protein
VWDGEGFGNLFGEKRFLYARRAGEHENGAGAFAFFVGRGRHFGIKHAFGKRMHYMIPAMHLVEQGIPHFTDTPGQYGKKSHATLFRRMKAKSAAGFSKQG